LGSLWNGAAVLLFLWSGRNLSKLLAKEPPITFTQDFVEERYFGLGQVPWKYVLAVEPRTEKRRGIEYKTLFIEVTKPWTYLSSVSLYQRMFMPLRTWRTQWLPLYFGAFNKDFHDAIAWLQAYKPDIPIRSQEK